jgi:type I restriction enzyme M protein
LHRCGLFDAYVEINFNKVFYKPEKLRAVEDILAEIESLDQELRELEVGLRL